MTTLWMIVLIPLLQKCLMQIKVNIGDRVVVKFEGADFHGDVTDFFIT